VGTRGPKPKVSPAELHFWAQEFYHDLRGLAEGSSRVWFDQNRFDRSLKDIQLIELSADERDRLRMDIDEDIQAGRVGENDQEAQLRVRIEDHLFMKRECLRQNAAEESQAIKNVPGDPQVLKSLLRAKTAQRVRQICKDAFVVRSVEFRHGDYRQFTVANWPMARGNGSMFPEYLSRHAEQFIAARNDSRFPRSNRPSSQPKQLWFLSRALAGALFKVTTRTAVNLIGSLRPDEMFEESRAAKRARRRTKSRAAS
jgi:hypothetical protein